MLIIHSHLMSPHQNISYAPCMVDLPVYTRLFSLLVGWKACVFFHGGWLSMANDSLPQALKIHLDNHPPCIDDTWICYLNYPCIVWYFLFTRGFPNILGPQPCPRCWPWNHEVCKGNHPEHLDTFLHFETWRYLDYDHWNYSCCITYSN